MNPTARRSGSWRDHAACLDSELELFFPIGHGPRAQAQTEAAKRICAGCPSRLPCLEWALRVRPEFGVWGGLSEDERRSRTRLVAPELATSGR